MTQEHGGKLERDTTKEIYDIEMKELDQDL